MKAYICGETWDLEAGKAPAFTIYCTVQDLKENHPVTECGIVEVDINFSRWIEIRTKIPTDSNANWSR